MWNEPCVMTRCGRDDDIQQTLRATLCVPTKRHLWVPADAITFVPALCDTIFGDGRALWYLATCNSRPAFYIVRGHSEWEESNWYSGPRHTFGEMVDHVYDALENQFGSATLDYEEDDPDRLLDGFNPWPALDRENGCGWAVQHWPRVFDGMVDLVKNEFGSASHSLLKREYAFEDHLARFADDGGRVLDQRR